MSNHQEILGSWKRNRNGKQIMSHKNEHRAGYKRTRLGWIPEDWKSERLKTLVKTNDQTLPESTDDDKR